MSVGRAALFDRKLEDEIVKRLQNGHRSDDLLAELRARLDDATAEAVLSRAEGRVARRTRSRGTMLTHILMGFVYVWTGVLLLQNLIVLATILQLSPSYGLGPLLPRLVILPVFNMTLLLGCLFAFRLQRSAITAALYAGAVLFVFPVGLFVGGRSDLQEADPGILSSLSAMLSYATALLIGVVCWQSRQTEPRVVARWEAFD